jgi:hypothetical protein
MFPTFRKIAVLSFIGSSVATRVAAQQNGVFCMGVWDEDKERAE